MDIAIVGYGRMGKLVERVLQEREDNITAIVDPAYERPWTDGSLDGAQCAICFTWPEAGYESAKRILESGTNAVVGTTKFYLNDDGTPNEQMLDELDQLTRNKGCGMIYSPNFSPGMNAFMEMLEDFAPVLAGLGYDVAVEERHHTGKADVSGSGRVIGKILLRAYRREGLSCGQCDRRREPNEITLASTRVGHEPGTHVVVFDSVPDTIELIHRVRDPAVFAYGAVDAAYWLREMPSGLYTMRDMIENMRQI